MGGIHVYFDRESEEIAKRMPKGELSRVCRKAVKEHGSLTEDQAILHKKEEFFAKEIERLELESKRVRERLDLLKERDDQEQLRLLNEKQKREVEETQARKHEEEQEFLLCKKYLNQMFETKEEEIDLLVTNYLSYKKDALTKGGSLMGFAAYFESVGLKKKKGW